MSRPLYPSPSAEPGGPVTGILIVDDEPMIRELALRALERGGFKVFQAADGKAAIALLEQHATEVVLALLDLTMPGLTGEQTLAVMHARWPGLRVVVMSGRDVQNMDSIRSLGVVGYIEKPYLPHELLHLVEDTLGIG